MDAKGQKTYMATCILINTLKTETGSFVLNPVAFTGSQLSVLSSVSD